MWQLRWSFRFFLLFVFSLGSGLLTPAYGMVLGLLGAGSPPLSWVTGYAVLDGSVLLVSLVASFGLHIWSSVLKTRHG